LLTAPQFQNSEIKEPSSTMIADGITTAVLLVAPEKVAVLTVMSAAAGTATLQPVAVLMADICVIRLEPEVPDATAVCTALAEETLVSTSIVNVIVAARRAAALEIATPVVYEMDPLAAVHQAVLTILTYAHS